MSSQRLTIPVLALGMLAVANGAHAEFINPLPEPDRRERVFVPPISEDALVLDLILNKEYRSLELERIEREQALREMNEKARENAN